MLPQCVLRRNTHRHPRCCGPLARDTTRPHSPPPSHFYIKITGLALHRSQEISSVDIPNQAFLGCNPTPPSSMISIYSNHLYLPQHGYYIILASFYTVTWLTCHNMSTIQPTFPMVTGLIHYQ